MGLGMRLVLLRPRRNQCAPFCALKMRGRSHAPTLLYIGPLGWNVKSVSHPNINI